MKADPLRRLPGPSGSARQPLPALLPFPYTRRSLPPAAGLWVGPHKHPPPHLVHHFLQEAPHLPGLGETLVLSVPSGQLDWTVMWGHSDPAPWLRDHSRVTSTLCASVSSSVPRGSSWLLSPRGLYLRTLLPSPNPAQSSQDIRGSLLRRHLSRGAPSLATALQQYYKT